MLHTIITGRIIIDAIKKTTQKRRATKSIATGYSGANGEIYLKFSTGITTREIVLTRDQIKAAYVKAFNKDAKSSLL